MEESSSSTDFRTLTELLAWRGEHQADRRAFAFLGDGERESDSLSYGELYLRVRRLAHELDSSGARGERALLLYPPGLDFVVAFLACLASGVVAVPAYPPDPRQLSRTLSRLQLIAADADPLFALTTEAVRRDIQPYAAMDPRFAAVRWIATDAPGEAGPAPERPTPPDPESLAFLQYTSGSTQSPRGVMVTHANIMHNQALIREAFQQDAESRVVGWLPVYHDMGLIGNVLHPLYLGAHCILMSPAAFLQKPVRWLQAIAHYRGTISGGPNFGFDLCVRKTTEEERRNLDLSSWNLAFNGAEPVRADTLDRFAAAFETSGFQARALRPCYGLAEATLIASSAPKGRVAARAFVDRSALESHQVVDSEPGDPGRTCLVSSGWDLTGMERRIVDPDTGALCDSGHVGEIWLRGPSVARGYWLRQEDTAAVFEATTPGLPGRWLRTGDLGFMTDREIFVTGRIKDLIILEGRNLYPQDLERVVEGADPAIRPGCTAAFAVDVDERERLVIVAEVDERGGAADPADVERKVRAALMREFSAPVHRVIVIRAGTIPKTSSGKIQRHAAKARFLEGSLEGAGGR